MNESRHSARLESETRRSDGIDHFGDVLPFHEVVSGADRA
jgi:hypothetical protein